MKKRNTPLNLTSSNQYLFDRDLQYSYPKIKYEIVKNIFIDNNGFIWKRFSFHNETFRNRDREPMPIIIQIKFFMKAFFVKKIVVEEGIWLIDSWSNNYFHWFGDVLYKIFLFPKKQNKLLLIPFQFSKYSYIIKSLELLEIDFILIPENKVLKVKKLNYLSFFSNETNLLMSHFSGNWINTKLIELRDALKKNLNKAHKNDKIYISRKNAEVRKIVNEELIEEILKKKGFKIYDFDKITWEQQIEICSSSITLVSINGAALTNMIFMQENSKIFEIRHPAGTEQNCFFSMCDALKFKYYYLIGEPQTYDFQTSDLKVNINEFKKYLRH